MIKVFIKEKTQETANITSFKLARTDGARLPEFNAGAHIDVQLKSALVRQYSLVNYANQQEHYQIAVLNDPQSRGGSIELTQSVQQGDELFISEPRNLFELNHDAKRYVLFAGGIGITPILAMAEQLTEKGADFELNYSAKSAASCAFFEKIQHSPLAVRSTFYFSEQGLVRRLDAESLLSKVEKYTHLYICGPKRYIDYVLSCAKNAGWPEQQVHREFFAADISTHEGDRAFEVVVASTGAIYPIPAEQSVFEVLDDAGIFIPVSCEQGVCGSCITKVLSGEPEHRDSFQSDSEKQKNDQFTPCCSRAKGSRLVLDL